MNCYIVEINGEPVVVAAFTADEAERMALMQFTGVVTSVAVRIAEDAECVNYAVSSSATGA
jgi:hypothetical protein